MKTGNTVSCGVIVTDSQKFLLCHPTNSDWWDIPKGKQEPGEDYICTAVRELEEETGIKVTASDLKFKGVFAYKSDKDLAIFMLVLDYLPPIESLHCASTFDNGIQKLPEMDSFKYANRDTFIKNLNKNMQKIMIFLV